LEGVFNRDFGFPIINSQLLSGTNRFGGDHFPDLRRSWDEPNLEWFWPHVLRVGVSEDV
jgi:hypothetical protein